ncbi:MAG TPA: arginase family protein [Streptosporangiaceae bacterium]|nr:arginase family protein [Streptosporangiaceae bacterium]
MPVRKVAIIGAASSAGAHHAGRIAFRPRCALPVSSPGGDCTVTLGVMAGIQRHDPGAGLLYFDGDANLATPQTTSSGVLDAMGIAHLMGLTDNPLARLGTRWPMLTDARLVLFGYDETDPETHRARPSGAALTRYIDAVAGALAAARTDSR